MKLTESVGAPLSEVGALAGTFVEVISNPGRCRSAKPDLLTGQHTDLYTTRAPGKAAVNGVLSVARSILVRAAFLRRVRLTLSPNPPPRTGLRLISYFKR
jgi:hypothetical protein